MTHDDDFERPRRDDDSEELLDELIALVRRGRKIEAIKLLRDRDGMSLKAAKEEVEEITERLRAAGELDGALASRSGCGAASLAVITGVTITLWFAATRSF